MARQMKDSGVEWIGEIPEDWDILPLGNCFNERNEKVSDYDWEPLSVTKQGIVKQLETAAKSDAHDARKKVCERDFVINSRSDRKQSCGVSPYDGSVSLINIVLSSRFLNTEYVKYLLKNYGFAEEFYRWGTGIVADLWSTKYERMKKIMLPIPDETKQQKIADFLNEKVGEIDSVIAKTKEIIEDYKKYKQAIITDAVTKGLNPDVEMKDTNSEWIGKIPAHWNLTKIKVISEKITDGAHISPETSNGKYDFVSTVNLGNHVIDFESCLKTSESSYQQLVKNGCKPQINDVLISKDGTVGKTVVIDFDREFVVASSLVIIRPNLELINPYYLDYNLQAKFVQEQLIMVMHGAGLKRVSVEKNANLPVLLPPLEEQREIAEYLDEKCCEIDKLVAKKEELLVDLEDYKKSLIYEYVTGKKEIY